MFILLHRSVVFIETVRSMRSWYSKYTSMHHVKCSFVSSCLNNYKLRWEEGSVIDQIFFLVRWHRNSHSDTRIVHSVFQSLSSTLARWVQHAHKRMHCHLSTMLCYFSSKEVFYLNVGAFKTLLVCGSLLVISSLFFFLVLNVSWYLMLRHERI